MLELSSSQTTKVFKHGFRLADSRGASQSEAILKLLSTQIYFSLDFLSVLCLQLFVTYAAKYSLKQVLKWIQFWSLLKEYFLWTYRFGYIPHLLNVFKGIKVFEQLNVLHNVLKVFVWPQRVFKCGYENSVNLIIFTFLLVHPYCLEEERYKMCSLNPCS